MVSANSGPHLTRIRLELARTPEFPQGSAKHGYEFIAPLRPDHHIDAEGWKKVKNHCGVLRFWDAEPPERGMLRRVGQGWRFDYHSRDSDDDEPFFKLDRHELAVGSYVSVTEHDGVQRPFRIVSMTPVVRAAWQPAALATSNS
jgi:hypothetical protein